MAAAFEGLTRTFLLSKTDGATLEPAGLLAASADQRHMRRHQKSRRGCQICKQRKVKCDERAPCSNCARRHDKCSLVDKHGSSSHKPSPSALVSLRDDVRNTRIEIIGELNPLPFGDSKVNMLHMELFYHFTKLTTPTLYFAGVWEDLVPQSFHREYLMNAMLAVAARHLSILRPTDTRYAHTAMSLLSSACSSYRRMLNLEITADNSDALIGTSILIYCLSWCNLDFLEGQDLEDPGKRLDLSGDQLFLLSPGVRHVFFTAWQVPGAHNTLFARIASKKHCDALQGILENRGVDFEKVAHEFMAVYEDKRFHGQGRTAFPTSSAGSSPATTSCPQTTGSLAQKPPFISPVLFDARQTTDLRIIHAMAREEVRHSPAHQQPSPQSPATQELQVNTTPSVDNSSSRFHSSFSYRRVAMKLSIIVALLLGDDECYSSSPDPTSSPRPPPSTPIFLPSRSDLNRYFLSFPIICLGPFLDMMFESERPALVVMYHFYRAARDLLGGTTETWWAAERAVVMEKVLRGELARKGFRTCLRREMEGTYKREQGEMLKCPMGRKFCR